jgi:hypothetical protein
MKLRIAALALALAFVAAPALAAIAHPGCAPCGMDDGAGGPCTSFTALSCCTDMGSSAPLKPAPDASSLQALAQSGVMVWVAAAAPAPRAAHEIANGTSPLRLSVVRRL